MDIVTFLIIISILYAVLLFFDTFFKTCAHYPYIQFLKGTGLEVKLFRFSWQTKFFNRILVRWGSTFIRCFNVWFNVGLYVSIILLPFAVFLLFLATCHIFIKRGNLDDKVTLQPVVPGVNLPASELGYYIASIIICSVIHEVGHALAAVNEDVHIDSVGLFVFFIIPIAYVNLNTDKLAKIGTWKSLRIFSAGVWHNIVLAAICWILYYSSPFFFSVFYYVNNGIMVTNVIGKSPLSGSKGLHNEDIITKINGCFVKTAEDWDNCLLKSGENRIGFCVDSDFIHMLDESVPTFHDSSGVLNCCDLKKKENLCFEYLESDDGVIEMPQHLCLPARKIIERFEHYCYSKSNCPNRLHCIRPVLSNSTFLFNFKRLSKSNVIYIGHYNDVFSSVEVSSFIPRIVFTSAVFPMVVTRLLLYLTVFSFGLAIVNLIPCYYMDGQHIVRSVILLFLSSRFDKQKLNSVTQVITLVGTILFCFNCVVNLFYLL